MPHLEFLLQHSTADCHKLWAAATRELLTAVTFIQCSPLPLELGLQCQQCVCIVWQLQGVAAVQMSRQQGQ